MIKVRIKKQAKAKTGYQVQGSLVNDTAPMGGSDFNHHMGKPKLRESKYITADPRDESNVEAEGGEVVYGDLNGDMFPEAQIIKGPRHSAGGVPLNLPEDTFIYSDTRRMRIKDCEILQMFGKPCGKKSYTPAELAKQYDINSYRVILEDPNSNAIEKKTAELMIKKYVVKLGCLALKQESMKGFPQGIPAVARPCMEVKGITDEDILPSKELAVLKDKLSELNKPKSGEGGGENMINEAMDLNDGNPVAEPEPLEQAPQVPQGMETGGYSDVYRQQKQQEAMMQQQQAAQDPMMQIVQQVQAALQQGSAPEQIAQALLQQFQPQEVAQIFLQIGASEEEAVAIVQAAMQQPVDQQMMQQPQMAKFGTIVNDSLPKASGGHIVTIDESEYDTPEEFQNALKRAYIDSGRGANKIYVKSKDGKTYEQKVSAKRHTEYTGSDLESGWNNNQTAAATFTAMKKTFEDPTAKKIFADRVRKSLVDDKNYYNKKGNAITKWDDRSFSKKAADLTDDEIVEKYMRMQERNLKTMTYADKLDIPVFGSWMYKDGSTGIRGYRSTGDGEDDNLGFYEQVKKAKPELEDAEILQMYNKIKNNGYGDLSKVGAEMGLPMKTAGFKEEAMIEQAGFIAANDLMKELDANPDAFNPDEQYSLLGITSFAGWEPYGKQVGFDDEDGMGETNISPIDGWYTNTTWGEIQDHHGLQFQNIEDCQCTDPEEPNYSTLKDAEGNCTCEETVPDKCPCVYSDGTEVMMQPDANGDCPPCQEDKEIPVPGGQAEWWLQDTIKTTGAFGDLMGVKKYMPWAPGVDLEEPRPTYLDPTRELAANAEQANIQTQGAGQFAGAQAQSARSTSVQGAAAKNAADVLSKYNNANVNIANEFELKATDVRNQESMLRQANSQKLYDQNTIANQQYDNSRLAMRNNLRNQYTNAITNKWKTDAMNQMYPDYAVDPSVGGQMYHTPNTRTATGQRSGMTMQEAMDWCKKNDPKNPSACMTRVMNAQKGNSSSQSSPPNMYPQFNKDGGSVTGDTGYVYYNPWLDGIM
jgi:hypothetical protein